MHRTLNKTCCTKDAKTIPNTVQDKVMVESDRNQSTGA